MARSFSRIDALIHCAGIIRSGSYDQISDTDFDTVIAVNLTGAFNIARAFTPTMVAQGSGSIVNVASVAAQRGGGLVGGAHYAASKGGVLSLTKSLARELGPSGVRVSAVCPFADRDRLRHVRRFRRPYPRSYVRHSFGPAGPAGGGRRDLPVLASDLSSYITGATLDVNGGSHIH